MVLRTHPTLAKRLMLGILVTFNQVCDAIIAKHLPERKGITYQLFGVQNLFWIKVSFILALIYINILSVQSSLRRAR
jgi:hypothetical protein